jgi:WD40 repeat protein
MDGGLRFWVMRAGDRTADISKLHEGGITSVQFHPTNAMQVLTNGTCFCVYADTFALSGSSTSGEIFVWRVADGQLEKKLSAH